MQKMVGDWRDFRKLPGRILEVDFHPNSPDLPDNMRDLNYSAKMNAWVKLTKASLARGQREGYDWILFTHGHSTSHRPGSQTARSIVRGIIRDKEATPYILRSKSYQHNSVMMVRLRPQQDTNDDV